MTKRPSRRSINKIISRNVFGWNDKRKHGNRIKLVERLSTTQAIKLHDELPKMHPGFKFTVEDFVWKVQGYGCGHTVTVIRYSEIYLQRTKVK